MNGKGVECESRSRGGQTVANAEGSRIRGRGPRRVTKIRQCVGTLAIAFLSVLVAWSLAPGGAARASHKPVCAVELFGGANMCLPAAEVRRAERLMPVPPVNPSQIVSGRVHLRLNQVVISRAPSGAARAILYVFGHVSATGGIIDVPAPARPKYVVVEEYVDVSGRAGMTLTNDAPGHPFGPWDLRARLDGTTLRMILTADFKRQVVKGLGTAVLRESHRGK